MARTWIPGLSVFERLRPPAAAARQPGSGRELRLDAVVRQLRQIESRRFRDPGDHAEHAALLRERADLMRSSPKVLHASG